MLCANFAQSRETLGCIGHRQERRHTRSRRTIPPNAAKELMPRYLALKLGGKFVQISHYKLPITRGVQFLLDFTFAFRTLSFTSTQKHRRSIVQGWCSTASFPGTTTAPSWNVTWGSGGEGRGDLVPSDIPSASIGLPVAACSAGLPC